MNSLVRAQIQAIEHETNRMGETLRSLQARIEALDEEKGEALQKRWSLERQVSVLQRTADDYDRLSGEAEHLRERQDEIRAALTRMREQAKALAEYLRQ